MTSLSLVADMPIDKLVKLSAKELKQLQDEANDFCEQSKACKVRIADAIGFKYGIRALDLRQQLQKDSGVVHLNDDGISIAADVSKKIQWDQKKLQNIAKRITAEGDDPSEFMTITYSVSESKYKSWSEALREQFSSARIPNFGKQSFVLSESKEVAI